MTIAKNRAEDRAIAAEAREKQAYTDANIKLSAKIKEVEQDRPSMKNQMELIQFMRENARLQKENNVLRKIIDEIKEHVRERFPQLCEAIEKAMTSQQRPQGKQNRDMER
jgi:regulator of replication initiation timing